MNAQTRDTLGVVGFLFGGMLLAVVLLIAQLAGFFLATAVVVFLTLAAVYAFVHQVLRVPGQVFVWQEQRRLEEIPVQPIPQAVRPWTVVAQVVETRGPACPLGFYAGQRVAVDMLHMEQAKLCQPARRSLMPYLTQALEGKLAADVRISCSCPLKDRGILFSLIPQPPVFAPSVA